MFINFFNNQRSVKRSGGFTAFVILLIMGLALHYFSFNIVKKGEDSLKWPKVTGVVIESEVARSKDSQGSEIYSPKIIVKYDVNGREFQTNQIDSFGSYSTSNFMKIQEIVSRYPKNKNVDVYYNDKIPHEALLEPGVPRLSSILQYLAYFLFLLAFLIMVKFIIIVGIIGIFMVNFFNKKKQKNPHHDATNTNQASNSNQISNQNKEINFNDDGFSQ